MKLLPHQIDGLEKTKSFDRCAYYWSMGLGKTYVGSEKLISFNSANNLIICQKSKVDDWLEHMQSHYSIQTFDLTKPKQFKLFIEYSQRKIGIINYELVYRRKQLYDLESLAIVLDESSLIKNETTKRTKAIFDLGASKVVLLSGTPVGGKYEELYSQCQLLGWNITKERFWSRYINYRNWYPSQYLPPIKLVCGYKNVDELKHNLRIHGADFLSEREVLDLPEQLFQTHYIPTINEYNTMLEDRFTIIDGEEIRGDTKLTQLLGLRKLCGSLNVHKRQALDDILKSTSERVIVFYNFNDELTLLKKLVPDKKFSIVSGPKKDLRAYNEYSDSVTFVQYQAGAMGLNLQKANRIVYFTLPLSSELFEQSKKRIHRIGQDKTCYYHYLICKDSVEEDILDTLNKRNDYTMELFRH